MQADAEHVRVLKERYQCPHFRILVMGRANAGKTTILEKVCGVAHGTKPIIYDQNGVVLKIEHKPKTTVFDKVMHIFGKKALPVSSANAHMPLSPSIEVSNA